MLETGQEIMELDHSGFSTQGPTIHAGNIGNNRFILQVTANGVRLMEGGQNQRSVIVVVVFFLSYFNFFFFCFCFCFG